MCFSLTAGEPAQGKVQIRSFMGAFYNSSCEYENFNEKGHWLFIIIRERMALKALHNEVGM